MKKRLSAVAVSALLCGGYVCSAAAASDDCTPVEEAIRSQNKFLKPCQDWQRGIENQRKADLGNGFYLNPIMPGDHPDPSILKDGDDYYMTFSTFQAYPALTIWHSRDLVNWEPVGPAVKEYIGSIWAPELTKHNGRYYLYIPAKLPGHNSIYVVYADDIHGPWSDPIDMDPKDIHPDRIDPGHAVGEDGKRYLFYSHGDYSQISDDGLSIVGDIKHTYDGWRYPEEWVVEGYAQEGPKITRHGDYYYMTTAVGGTAGPPTGHMVITARSKSIHGPWENSPYNPVVRTTSFAEKWWSRGHATLVQGPGAEGPDDEWYMVYHGYENGYYNLGRQALLEPIEWTEDGWYKTRGYDVGKPIPKPKGGEAVVHGMALSDDFSTNKFGIQWAFFKGDIEENKRVKYKKGKLVLGAEGSTPGDSSPLTFIAGDQAYQFEVDIEFDEKAQGGVLLFYNDKLYAGLGVNKDDFIMHRYGMERTMGKPAGIDNKVRLRVTNNRHILTIHYSTDKGETWGKFETQMEVSGYHHNVAYGFLALKPAIYAAGEGEVRFDNFVYRALP